MGVQRLMSMMEPGYLDSRTDTASAMRRCLYAGAIAVADADGEISKDEIKVFEQFFGKGEFNKSLNIELIKARFPERIQRMKELTSTTQQMQVLRDLCIMSHANGKSKKSQRAVLDEIAKQLGVSTSFICQSLEFDAVPD